MKESVATRSSSADREGEGVRITTSRPAPNQCASIIFGIIGYSSTITFLKNNGYCF